MTALYPDEKTLYQAIFRSLRSALDLTEAEANVHLLRAYSDVPAMEPAPDMNLCYYYLHTTPTAPFLQESTLTNAIPSVWSFIPCKLFLIFYGADCETWAHQCRSFLFLDGTKLPRGILRAASLHLIPKPLPPSIIYEETGKVFRKRADVTIDARLVSDASYGSIISHTPSEVDTVATVPDVKIHVHGIESS